MQTINEKTGSHRTQSIMLFLLARGEFKVLNVIMLLAVYGAAILAIPLVLNSLFQLSSVFLQSQQVTTFAALLTSIYNQIQNSYLLVEISLFLGFGLTSLVSGIAVGRRMAIVDTGLTHLGVSSSERMGAAAGVISLISLVSLALSFAFSFVFASIALYSASLFLHGPFLTPSLNTEFWIFLTLIPLISFCALTTGWSRTRAVVH